MSNKMTETNVAIAHRSIEIAEKNVDRMNEKLENMEERYNMLNKRFYICDKYLEAKQERWHKSLKHAPGPDTPFDDAVCVRDNVMNIDKNIMHIMQDIPEMVDKMCQISEDMAYPMLDEEGFGPTGRPSGDADFVKYLPAYARTIAETAGKACEQLLGRFEEEIDNFAAKLMEMGV